MPKFKLEEFLLPHEHDGEGKRLEEPKEIDVEQLRKYVYGLLEDKEKAQEARATAETERAQIADQLAQVQREHENDEQRRAREEKEREERYAKLEAREKEREKVDAIERAFEEQGITPGQAKKLAKRVSGDNEQAWLADAKELVEDGFKIGTGKPAKEAEAPADDESDDDLTSRPVRARRSDGTIPTTATGRPKSVAEELEQAGIGQIGW